MKNNTNLKGVYSLYEVDPNTKKEKLIGGGENYVTPYVTTMLSSMLDLSMGFMVDRMVNEYDIDFKLDFNGRKSLSVGFPVWFSYNLSSYNSVSVPDKTNYFELVGMKQTFKNHITNHNPITDLKGDILKDEVSFRSGYSSSINENISVFTLPKYDNTLTQPLNQQNVLSVTLEPTEDVDFGSIMLRSKPFKSNSGKDNILKNNYDSYGFCLEYRDRSFPVYFGLLPDVLKGSMDIVLGGESYETTLLSYDIKNNTFLFPFKEGYKEDKFIHFRTTPLFFDKPFEYEGKKFSCISSVCDNNGEVFEKGDKLFGYNLDSGKFEILEHSFNLPYYHGITSAFVKDGNIYNTVVNFNNSLSYTGFFPRFDNNVKKIESFIFEQKSSEKIELVEEDGLFNLGDIIKGIPFRPFSITNNPLNNSEYYIFDIVRCKMLVTDNLDDVSNNILKIVDTCSSVVFTDGVENYFLNSNLSRFGMVEKEPLESLRTVFSEFIKSSTIRRFYTYITKVDDSTDMLSFLSDIGGDGKPLKLSKDKKYTLSYNLVVDNSKEV